MQALWLFLLTLFFNYLLLTKHWYSYYHLLILRLTIDFYNIQKIQWQRRRKHPRVRKFHNNKYRHQIIANILFKSSLVHLHISLSQPCLFIFCNLSLIITNFTVDFIFAIVILLICSCKLWWLSFSLKFLHSSTKLCLPYWL